MLAITETAIASAFTLYLAYRYESLRPLVVTASVAPLLLLRTEQTRNLLYEWVEGPLLLLNTKLEECAARLEMFVHYSFAVALLVPLNFLLPIVLVALRAFVLAVGVIRWPMQCVSAIPGNWVRTALATDMFHPPEPLPDCETRSGQLAEGFRISTKIERLREARAEPKYRTSLMLFVVVQVLLLYVPAAMYRLSVKSSAIVYLPLIWVIQSRRAPDASARERLEGVLEAPQEQLRRWYAGFVIVGLTLLPFVLIVQVEPVIHAAEKVLGRQLVSFWLLTGEIQLWHVARLLAAGLTIALWFFADTALRRARHGRAFADGVVYATIDGANFVRGIIGLYSVAVGLYIVLRSVEWPSFTFRLWP